MITVKDLMNKNVVTLKDTDSVRSARELMEKHRVRHIPIVNEADEFVGLLTQRDLLATTVSALSDLEDDQIEAMESNVLIEEVMTTDVTVVDAKTDLHNAAQILLDRKYGCLPVVKGGKVLGIVTDTDFVALAVKLLTKEKKSGQKKKGS